MGTVSCTTLNLDGMNRSRIAVARREAMLTPDNSPCCSDPPRPTMLVRQSPRLPSKQLILVDSTVMVVGVAHPMLVEAVEATFNDWGNRMSKHCHPLNYSMLGGVRSLGAVRPRGLLVTSLLRVFRVAHDMETNRGKPASLQQLLMQPFITVQVQQRHISPPVISLLSQHPRACLAKTTMNTRRSS